MRSKTLEYLNFFEKTLNLPGIAWWLIDYREDDSCFYCNQNMCDFFYLDSDLEKHSISETCPIAGDYNKQVQEADELIAKQIISEYTQMLDGKADAYNNRFPFFCIKTQKTHYFSSRAKVLEKDKNGKPEIIYGIIEDISAEMEKTKLLEKLSERDPLTELYNRLSLDKFLYHNVQRFKRQQPPFSVLFIDIDDFKEINDTFGHQVGDQVLQDSAKVILSTIREVDIAGRWGGEEFMVICEETNREQARELATRLHNSIKENNIAKVFDITISIGCSEFLEDDTLPGFIHRVDKAMYQSKTSGKNQTTIF